MHAPTFTRSKPTMNANKASHAFGLVLACLAGFSCEEATSGGSTTTTTTATGAARAAATAADTTEAAANTTEFQDSDFVESDTNRDPFRNFASFFLMRPESTAGRQRSVVMDQVPLEAMKLIAVIGGSEPRAMLVDPEGVGHTVRRGDYLGRAEVVQTGGAESVPITLNWRVERIRPSQAERPAELVLSRDDPTSPSRAPIMRIMPLVDQNAR